MTSRDLACCLACCALPLQYSVSTRRFRQTWHCDNVRLGGHYLLHGRSTGYDSLHHSHASCLTSSPATPLSPPYASQPEVNTARIWQSHGPHHCPPATTLGHWHRSHFKSGLKPVYLGRFFERRGTRTRVAATQVCLRHRHRELPCRVLDGMSARIGLVARLPRQHTRPISPGACTYCPNLSGIRGSPPCTSMHVARYMRIPKEKTRIRGPASWCFLSGFFRPIGPPSRHVTFNTGRRKS
jgi:hypothetical protein